MKFSKTLKFIIVTSFTYLIFGCATTPVYALNSLDKNVDYYMGNQVVKIESARFRLIFKTEV